MKLNCITHIVVVRLCVFNSQKFSVICMIETDKVAQQ